MAKEKRDPDVLSLNVAPGASYVPTEVSGIPPRLPYTQSWKDFRKLQNNARGQKFAVLHLSLQFVTFSLGAFGIHEWKQAKSLFIAVMAALFLIIYLHWRNSRDRFLHWPCPRCGSEWPGDKKEKDRACRVCGLRLYQESA